MWPSHVTGNTCYHLPCTLYHFTVHKTGSKWICISTVVTFHFPTSQSSDSTNCTFAQGSHKMTHSYKHFHLWLYVYHVFLWLYISQWFTYVQCYRYKYTCMLKDIDGKSRLWQKTGNEQTFLPGKRNELLPEEHFLGWSKYLQHKFSDIPFS